MEARLPENFTKWTTTWKYSTKSIRKRQGFLKNKAWSCLAIFINHLISALNPSQETLDQITELHPMILNLTRVWNFNSICGCCLSLNGSERFLISAECPTQWRLSNVPRRTVHTNADKLEKRHFKHPQHCPFGKCGHQHNVDFWGTRSSFRLETDHESDCGILF